jgi:hypothetical protein
MGGVVLYRSSTCRMNMGIENHNKTPKNSPYRAQSKLKYPVAVGATTDSSAEAPIEMPRHCLEA